MEQGRPLPVHVQHEFSAHPKCVQQGAWTASSWPACRHEHLFAFSCKERGLMNEKQPITLFPLSSC
jgi:hypothetical protein